MISNVFYDCIIIGGGVAGAAAAHTLSQKKIKVLLIDREENNQRDKVGECLSGQGRYLLKQTGLYKWALKSNPIDNSGDLSSWGSKALIEKDFIFDKYGSGWHIDRKAFDYWLKMAALSAGSHYLKANVRKLENHETNYWKVYLAGKTLQTRWLIDASGRNSIVAKHIGIERIEDEKLIALFRWGADHSDEARTMIEAVDNGWWYTAKLPAGRRITVFHTSPDTAQVLLNNPTLYMKSLSETDHLRKHCLLDNSFTKLRGADATGSLLTKTYGANWVAIGDAAITFDPLAAHGIVNALAHGISGGDAVFKAIKGDYSNLITLNEEVITKREKYIEDINNLYLTEKRWNNKFWRVKCHQIPIQVM